MIGRGFKSVVWVATIGVAALVCYMFSLRVAEERAGLAELEGQIRRTEQSIQTLKTELGTRSRVHQLQHWAAADFGFASPTANQFMKDEITLASLDMPAAAPALESPVQMAAAPAPVAVPEPRKPVQAVAQVPAPSPPTVRRASTQPAAADRNLLRRASVVEAPAATARPKPANPAAAARAPAARPALVAERTLQAIDRSAQAERGAARTAGRPR